MSRKEKPRIDLGCVRKLNPTECPNGYVIENVKASTEVDGTVYEGTAETFRPNTWDALMALGKAHVVEKYFAAWDIEAKSPVRRMLETKVLGNGTPAKRKQAGYVKFIFTEEDDASVTE